VALLATASVSPASLAAMLPPLLGPLLIAAGSPVLESSPVLVSSPVSGVVVVVSSAPVLVPGVAGAGAGLAGAGARDAGGAGVARARVSPVVGTSPVLVPGVPVPVLPAVPVSS
jgi:hypothetical protein